MVIVSACSQRFTESMRVVGIDDQGLGELPGRTGEMGQHQDTFFVVTGGDEFLGDEIHSVMQAADDADIGRPE